MMLKASGESPRADCEVVGDGVMVAGRSVSARGRPGQIIFCAVGWRNETPVLAKIFYKIGLRSKSESLTHPALTRRSRKKAWSRPALQHRDRAVVRDDVFGQRLFGQRQRSAGTIRNDPRVGFLPNELGDTGENGRTARDHAG